MCAPMMSASGIFTVAPTNVRYLKLYASKTPFVRLKDVFETFRRRFQSEHMSVHLLNKIHEYLKERRF